jgi:ABC-2 type transport system permease protein
MKTTFRIARLELSTLFYSPVAWLVLIIFTFQSGLGFMDILQNTKSTTDLAPDVPGLTSGVFNSINGIFWAVQRNLYLYMPLLTMGLVSREISSGSVKLLLSSPIRIREIVLGKFIAMMGYGLFMVMVLVLFAFSAHLSIGSADMGLIFSGIFGLYLLILAYSAIGLLMSCLTSYQVIAAISTFVVLAALSFIGTLWQDIDLVRNITYFLSISGRSGQMIMGLISTKDLFYFLIVIGLFLGLTVLVLQSWRESRNLRLQITRYSLLSAGVIVAGLLTSMPALTWYYDATATKTQTLTVATQEVLKQLKGPLKIHTYVNFLDNFYEAGLPAERSKDHRFFERYQRFLSHDIDIDYTYYYDSSMNERLYIDNPGLNTRELAQTVADAKEFDFDKLLGPDQMRKIVDLKPEQYRYVRQLESGGKTSFLRMFYSMDPRPGENEITSAIKKLEVPSPMIAFLTGHNERSAFKQGDQDYSDRLTMLPGQHSLVNHGYDFMEIDLDKMDIPANISVLVIADPGLDIQPEEMTKIRQYIANGGNLWIQGEPGRQDKLSPLINPMGVHFMEGMLLEESREFTPNFIMANFSPQSAAYSEKIRELIRDSAHVTTHGVAGLTYDKTGPFSIDPFVISNKDISWNRVGTVKVDTGHIPFDPALGDRKETIPLALALKRPLKNREQRIMIFGDADFISNGEFSGVPKKNWELTEEVLKWLTYGDFPIDTRRPKEPDNTMIISAAGMATLRTGFLGVIPGLLLLGGAVLLIRRRRA